MIWPEDEEEKADKGLQVLKKCAEMHSEQGTCTRPAEIEYFLTQSLRKDCLYRGVI